jgi:hypothetical protein
MLYEKTKDIPVLQVSCSDAERYLPPARSAVDAMKNTLEQNGQVNPIGVYPITRNSYRLISGATRFRAASELGWQKIRASIWTGTAVDFEIHELAENADRSGLTSQQRREMRAKIKELQRQQLAEVASGKPGRGNKGGLREAARQARLPRTTAQDRQRENKMAGNENMRPFSAEPLAAEAPPPSTAFARKKYSVDMSLGEFRQVSAWCEQQHISVAEGFRRIIREWLDSKHRPPVNGAAHIEHQEHFS